MKLAQTTTTTATTTTTLKISTPLRRKLLTNLKAYAELAAQRKAIDQAMKGHAKAAGLIREGLGEQSIALEGFKVSEVRGTYKKLNREKYVELGGALAILDEATEEKPKRPYDKITCPGEKDRDGEDD